MPRRDDAQMLAKPLNVHVLVDLDWTPRAGGQVVCWQHLAAAAAGVPDLSLTIHAQGADEERPLPSGARLFLHEPVFSTRRLSFLGDAPAQADLARYHPSLARAIADADVIHTTDGLFAYARTAAEVARRRNIALVTSIHTDTVAYTELFTRALLRERLGAKIGAFLDEYVRLPRIAAARMRVRLMRHQQQCRFVMVSREEDREEAARTVSPQRLRAYRLGVDHSLFSPARREPSALRQRFAVPDDATILVFAGRLDEGKNIGRLVGAVERLVSRGHACFLVAVGEGPQAQAIRTRLAGHAATPGFLDAADLAAIYASADWLALPSQIETWSLVAGEALACGLPIVAAARSGVARFLGPEKAGLIVDEDTDAAWEAALIQARALAGRETMRRTAAEAGRARFPSWQDVLRQDFLPVWREAARGPAWPRVA